MQSPAVPASITPSRCLHLISDSEFPGQRRKRIFKSIRLLRQQDTVTGSEQMMQQFWDACGIIVLGCKWEAAVPRGKRD